MIGKRSALQSSILFVFLALAVLFGPWNMGFAVRVSIAAILTATSFYFYLKYKFVRWKAAGTNPGLALLGRVVGALLGGCAALLGGLVSGLSRSHGSASELEVLLVIEGLFGGVFGLLLGASAGISDDRLKHVLVGAVSGGFGGSMGGAMGALFPGTSSSQIIFSALAPGVAGAISGALLGLTWRRLHQLLLAVFPQLGEK